MVLSDEQSWWVQLDEEASSRIDQGSFHICAEGMLSDFRAQIFNLHAGESVPVVNTHWPHHMSIVICITGSIEAKLPNRSFQMRQLSQLVVLPGISCVLTAHEDSALEMMSFLSAPPIANPSI